MMHIDERIPANVLAQFAAQEGFIKAHIVSTLGEQFSHTQSRDFYEGLAAGLRYCYQMADRGEKKEIMGIVLAMTSGHLTRMPEYAVEQNEHRLNIRAQQEAAEEKHDEQMAIVRRLGMGASVSDLRSMGLDIPHGAVPDNFVLKSIVVDGFAFGPP